MRLAAGLLIPDRGRIQVLGLDALASPLSVQSAIGYMPQRFGLYEDLSVRENLDLYADLQGLAAAGRLARFAELLHMTGLAPFTARLAGRLSGGMKQKLGLACTLLKSPRLLLLDEPTVGVDPVSRRELWRIVYRQVEENGMSVLLSTAYLDEAERCAEVVLLHQGRVLGQDTPQHFSKRMAGRSFRVSAAGMRPRQLQQRLATAPGVLDAVIDGDRVRLVTREAAMPNPARLLPELDVDAIEVSAVPPRFEDAFVALLRDDNQAPADTPVAVEVQGSLGEEVIRVRGLQRRFGAFVAVKGTDFSVRRGEIFGLLGANGAGKTTTFRMLCGLLPASAGEISVAGRNLRTAAAEARSRIGYMAQKFSLYGNLTVAQNLRFYASAYGLRGHRRRSRIDWALETFALTEYTDANSGQLPLGYKQRLAFAAALMHEPEILFLDEPTSGIDPLARREFWARTNALAEAGVTVLVTTHFMDEANYCDRMAIMADGEILTEGTPREIKQRASTPEHPEPTMEDAFLHLIQHREAQP
jgi:ABC-2 type transport system ATP-binding protein